MTDWSTYRANVPAVWPHLMDQVMVRGQGVYLWDANGRKYLDFTSGIGVTNTGHCHPKVVAAICEQAGRLMHLHGNSAYSEPQLRLIAALREVLPAELDRFFFANSGAEAVEAALKTVRFATGRPNVIAFQRSFHGRTVATASLTGSKTIYRSGFSPLMSGVFFAPYAYCYRCPMAEANPQKYGFDRDCDWELEQVQFLLRSQTAPSETAAILLEPVLGEGGYIVPPKRFLQGLRKICDQHGMLLVLDEIQTGFGRTGKLFAYEHFGVRPDIIIMSKGLASGLPVSGIITRQEIIDKSPPGSQGGTYGGNAVACASAAATVKVLHEEGLIDNAARLGPKLLAALEAMQKGDPTIGDVRGLGLMVGVEFVVPGSRAPDAARARAVRAACLKEGLILLTCGTDDNIIRWIPPLIITDGQLAEALDVFGRALRAA